jgi:hypothetical protein
LIDGQRAGELALGAPMRPHVEGLIDVRALDDAGALEAATPRWKDGKFRPDTDAAEKRRNAMAKILARAEEPVVAALLGGAHDLREPLAKRAPGVAYLGVTTRAYRDVSGGR